METPSGKNKVKIYAEIARYNLTHNAIGAYRIYFLAKIYADNRSAVNQKAFMAFCISIGYSKSRFYDNLQDAIHENLIVRSERADGVTMLAVRAMDKVVKEKCGAFTYAYYIDLDEVLYTDQALRAVMYGVAFDGLINVDRKEGIMISREKIEQTLGVSKRTQLNYEKHLKGQLEKIHNVADIGRTEDEHLTRETLAEKYNRTGLFVWFDNGTKKYKVYQVLPNLYVLDMSDRRASSNFKYIYKDKGGNSGTSKRQAETQPSNTGNTTNSLHFTSTKRGGHESEKEWLFPNDFGQGKKKLFFSDEKSALRSAKRQAIRQSKGQPPQPNDVLFRFYNCKKQLTFSQPVIGNSSRKRLTYQVWAMA